MTTTVKLNSSGLVKVTSGGTPTTIIDVTNTYKTISDIDTVSSNISSALSTATDAKSTANAASTTASDAKSTANAASTTASNAQSTANAAQSTASDAQSTATAASTTASDAKSTANAASKTASDAQSTASDALITANAASTSASNDTDLVRFDYMTTTFGEYPLSTMIVILHNSGSYKYIQGSDTTKILRGTDDDNEIGIPDWSTAFFVRISDDTFRLMLSVHDEKHPTERH